MVAVPTLTDARLALRAHHEDDVDRVVEQSRDPLSVQWTTVPESYTRGDATRFIRDIMPGGWATDQEWGFAVAVDGLFGGTVSLRNRGEGRAELAYGAHPATRGTGAMEQGLRLLLAWGFEHRDLQTVSWWANRGNFASRKLAWRVGFEIQPGVSRQWLPHRGELVDGWRGTLLRGAERLPRTPWLVPVTIELPDLRLRATRRSDVDRMVEACLDAQTTRWIGSIPRPTSRQLVEEYVADQHEAATRGTDLEWTVASLDDDRVLARVGLHGIDHPLGSAEIGYWTHPDARGRGVMRATVAAVCRHAFVDSSDGGLGLKRLYARVAVGNDASTAVLTSNGFAVLGTERLSVLTADGPTDGYRLDRLATETR